jgi:photosystem II stability/assembly factor-like uncharacterized protein
MTLYVGAAKWVGGTMGGVFRKENGGTRWERLALPDAAQVQALTLHPQRPEVLYAGTDVGLYRTLDAGDSWQRLDTPRGLQIWSVFVHPSDSRLLYAGTSPLGVLRSQDGGETWRRASVQLPQRVTMAFPCRVMRFAVNPARPENIYAALEVAGVMRSVDGGESWTDCADELVALANRHPHLRSRIQSDSDTEGMLDAHAVGTTAAQPGTVYLALRMGMFQSMDGGSSWTDMQVGRFSPLTYARDIRVSPHDPKVLFTCLSPASRSEDGSLYRSDDTGATWTRVDRGIKARATMMAVGFDPRNSGGIHCISRCGQVFSTGDGGATWEESLLPEGVEDLYAIACT